MNEVTTADRPVSAETLAHVLGTGDLSKLTTPQRVEYYAKTCQSLGLNPLTRPFRFLALNGQIQLYATRDATDQLRKVHGITLHIVDKQLDGELFLVTVRARTKDGREDEDLAAVTLGQLRGESRANALMKAMTKAKRRVTLSICGLGLTDEAELDTMPGAMVFDAEDTPPPVAPIRAAAAPMPRAARITEPEPPRAEAPQPQPRRMTWPQLLDSFNLALKDATTAGEIDHILRSNQMTEAKAHIGAARLEHQRRFDEIMVEADARRTALEDDAADPPVPEEDEVQIAGAENVAAG